LEIDVVALAGGVGGAKFVDGLAQNLPARSVSVIVNTGDDFEHLGLLICPDLDTITYTLAGIASSETGWGREDESWRCLETISTLGGETWFRLGDLDLGTHLVRTERTRNGELLSTVTRDFCRSFGIEVLVFPMTDDLVRTVVTTDQGELAFQQYFVREGCEPEVKSITFRGAENAGPAAGVLEILDKADVVIICPSNPWLSIDPILAIHEISVAVSRNACYAISPIIGGKSVRGPAAKIYRELGFEPSPLAVATHYQDFLTGLIIDEVDRLFSTQIEDLGMSCFVTNTLMKTATDRRELAAEVLSFIQEQEAIP
jgi:LPPG:FO 2-phospho-L-lactate transferase